MDRRRVLQGIAALALADGLAGLAWAADSRPAKPGLHRVSGQVTVNGKPAQAGMRVRPSDTIVTGPGAEAIYVVGQDAFLQRDNSTVSLVGDGVKRGLRILTGKLLAVFGKGDKRLETATATIGIRGTGCYIESEAERVYFCLCYGQAEIRPLSDPKQVEKVETRHHDHPMYIHRDGQRMMVPATVANHTDTELTLLEGLVGRRPPFQGDPDYGGY